jgi:hypothetical protein
MFCSMVGRREVSCVDMGDLISGAAARRYRPARRRLRSSVGDGGREVPLSISISLSEDTLPEELAPMMMN